MSQHSFFDNNYPELLIPPAVQTDVDSDWVAPFINSANRYAVLVVGGAVGTSLDVKVQQAKDSSGTGAKDIADADGNVLEITQLAGTDDDVLVGIDIIPSDLDDKNGFKYIQVQTTAVGTTLYGVVGIKYDTRYPGSLTHSDTYVETARLSPSDS